MADSVMGIKKVWNWLLCYLKNHLYPTKGQPIQMPFIDGPPAQHATCLADLPPEIVQEIAVFLPLASAAAFALCSRRISQVLGTQYWEALGSWRDAGGLKPSERVIGEAAIEPQGGERADFLALLDRDLPDYIFCGRCARLHIPIFERCSKADNERMCALGDLFRGSFIFALPRHLRFSLLQWTMKRSRMGLDCSKQLQFFFEASLRKRIYRVKEARIRAGKWLFRVHEWFILPVKRVSITSWDVQTTVCDHLHNLGLKNSLNKLIECRMHHWRDGVSCVLCTGLQQCRCCYTEFQLDVKEYGQGEIALILTRWLDLGECLTPFDPKWSRRMSPLTQELGQLWAREGVRFVPGSIKDLYEDGEDFSFNSIMSPSTEKELFYERASLHTFHM